MLDDPAIDASPDVSALKSPIVLDVVDGQHVNVIDLTPNALSTVVAHYLPFDTKLALASLVSAGPAQGFGR